MTTQNSRMLQRRDTAPNWNLANPILASGEVGYETDTGKMKLGDGVSNWVSLGYFTDVEYASIAEVVAGTENAKAVTPASGTEYLRRNATAQEIISAPVQFSTIPTTVADPTQDNEIPRKVYVDQQFSITAGSGSDAGKALRLDGSGKFPAAAIPSTALPYATNGEADAGVSQDTVISPAVGAHAYLRKNAGGTQTVNTQTDFAGNVLAQVTPSLNHHVTRLVDLNGRFQSNPFDTGSAFAGKGVILDADGKIDSLILPPITGTGTFLGSFDPETGAVIPGTLSAPVDGDPLRDDGEYWVVAIDSGATSAFWDFANGVPHPGPATGRIIELFIGDQVLYEDVSAIWHVAALGRGGAAGSYLPLNGSQPMSGNISMGGNQVNDATQMGGSGVIICNGNSFHLDLGDLQASSSVAGRNFLAIKNSNVSTERPNSLASGEMAFNIADRTSYIGVAGTVHGMTVPRWSDGAQYKTWDVVSREGGMYVAIADSLDQDPLGDTGVSFWFPLFGTPISVSTEIHVNDATGDDANGNGSFGQPFKTIGRAFQKAYTLIPLRGIYIDIMVAAGVYVNSSLTFARSYPYAGQVRVYGVDPGSGNYVTGMPHADFSTSHTAPITFTPGIRELRNTAGQLGTGATDIAFDNAVDQDRIDNDAFLRTQYQTIIQVSGVAIWQNDGGPLVGEVKHILFSTFINPTTPTINVPGLYIQERNSGYTELSNVAFSGFSHGIYNVSPNYRVAHSTFGEAEQPVILSGCFKSSIFTRAGSVTNLRNCFIQGGAEYGIDIENAVIGSKYYSGLDVGRSEFQISGCKLGGMHLENGSMEIQNTIITGTRTNNILMTANSSLRSNTLTLEGATARNLDMEQSSLELDGTTKIYGAAVHGARFDNGSNILCISGGGLFQIENCNTIGLFVLRGANFESREGVEVRNCGTGLFCRTNGTCDIRPITLQNNVNYDVQGDAGGIMQISGASINQSSTTPVNVHLRSGAKCVLEQPGTGNVGAGAIYDPAYDTLNNSGAWVGVS